jgi:hypothetical protein
MARGWESKAIESQQEDKGRTDSSGRRQALSPEQRARHERKRTLELVRARLSADLVASRVEAHRRMLEQALAAVDVELEALAGPSG